MALDARQIDWNTGVQLALAGPGPFLFGNESVESAFAGAFHPDALAEIQPTIDAASGRTPAAETVGALDFLDERIRQHLEGNKGASPGHPGEGP